MSAIKIYIVDDHQMLIDGLKALMNDPAQFKIVGESQSGKKALEEIPNLKPDILLTDINMPEMDGIELTKEVKKMFPNIKIIALSMFGERATISDMLEAGVNGYILKNTGKEELVAALTKVHGGGMYFSDEVSAEMMKAISQNQRTKEEDKKVNLTAREAEIIQLIAQELSNAMIADKLFISERTVETHRKNIFRKTETKSIVGLIKWAFENKIIQ
ncbi:MAG: response regulator transcription factor [Bacteroidia bacterium]|nr:response regulator transcription factor [Bacteroidia bacterium]